MAWAAGGTEHRFDFPREKVFAAAVSTVNKQGLKVKSVNESLGRIVVGTGMSLFSYGENVTIAVQALDADSTVVSLGSRLKMGTNFLAGGQHERNFEAILSGIDTELRFPGKRTQATAEPEIFELRLTNPGKKVDRTAKLLAESFDLDRDGAEAAARGERPLTGSFATTRGALNAIELWGGSGDMQAVSQTGGSEEAP